MKLKIIGFFHICMINKYLDIVKCQIDCMVSSGLYERLDHIYIGCLGSKNEFNKLKLVLAEYPKIEIYSFNIDILKYEFHTLQIVQDISCEKEKFYGFYIHTKGCNYPGNVGGKYWLDYMNYYNLTLWKDAVKSLDLGYYTYGVKLLPATYPPAFKMHYSGNFFWFNSEYVSTLPDINTLDKCNRYNAETWVCSGQPIAATGCQAFVDYNTKGAFEPYQNICNE
jgi:hypothetical protein